MSAVAPEQQEQEQERAEDEAPPIAEKPKMRVYAARREDLVLIWKKDTPQFNGPEQIGTTPGKQVKFDGGFLRVPLKGTFRGNRDEELDAAEAIEWLDGHRKFGDKDEGFWLHVEAPPIPTGAEQQRIVDLGMDLDAEGLRAFIEHEEANYNREPLLKVARGTLERVEQRAT